MQLGHTDCGQGKCKDGNSHDYSSLKTWSTRLYADRILVVVLILGILTAIALPSYLTSVNGSREQAANANARALASAVQSRATITNSYDTSLADYISDMGGAIPINPCTGTATGYTISATAATATVTAQVGTACGTWTPATFSMNL
jgi:type II secretory pathway pseudopilin PulG